MRSFGMLTSTARSSVGRRRGLYSDKTGPPSAATAAMQACARAQAQHEAAGPALAASRAQPWMHAMMHGNVCVCMVFLLVRPIHHSFDAYDEISNTTCILCFSYDLRLTDAAGRSIVLSRARPGAAPRPAY